MQIKAGFRGNEAGNASGKSPWRESETKESFWYNFNNKFRYMRHVARMTDYETSLLCF